MYIYDIGANEGNFIEACLSKYPEVTVISIEANTNLAKNIIQRFAGKNVLVFDFLVSTFDNVEVPFYISETHVISTASTDWINNSRFSGRYKWAPPVTKKTITLDKLISKYAEPDIIKIDVEGYELEVLKGLTKKQKKICVEWAEEQYENILYIFDYLENLGYSEFGFIEGDEYLKEPDAWWDKNTCISKMEMDSKRKQKWGMIWVK